MIINYHRPFLSKLILKFLSEPLENSIFAEIKIKNVFTLAMDGCQKQLGFSDQGRQVPQLLDRVEQLEGKEQLPIQRPRPREDRGRKPVS